MLYDIFYISKDRIAESDWLAFRSRFPSSQKIENVKTFTDIKKKAFTKFFWVVWDDLVVADDFNFEYRVSKWDEEYTHIWLNGKTFDGINLFPKTASITQKEFDYRFFMNKKEIDVVASTPKKFEIYNIKTYDDYLNAKEKSLTAMFWAVWDDVIVANDFLFDYYVPTYDAFHRNITHVFKNGEFFDGIILFSKYKDISKKEFDHRFYIDKKEVDIIASTPKQYDKFVIETYDEYLNAIETSSTEMFWIIPNDIVVNQEFKFELYFSHHNRYNRTTNHVFLNDKTYDGITLASTHKIISKREFEYRFLIEKKEWDIIASTPKPYNKFYINTYEEYLNVIETSTTEMFWVIWNDVVVDDTFKFEYYVPVYDTFHRNITHVFKNDSYYDGICLFSKKTIISKKEFDHRFFVNKKEVEINASTPRPYDKFVIETYDDYLNAREKSTSELFWIIPKEVEVLDTFDFNLYFSHHNSVERKLNHVFKHIFRGEETINGISLVPKDITLTKKEIDFRFLVEKKKYDVVATKLKPYDIVFISYNETTADENYENLRKRFPQAKRVHGIKGIHNAHIEAAKKADTDMFWVVDGDAIIVDDFNFNHEVSVYEKDIVHVWSSKNPINNLEYGYGGVKLLPRKLTISMDLSKPDMTTGISSKFKVLKAVSNITSFNTDPFSTWKSAFRECVKLSSKVIDRQVNDETEQRLNAWCILNESAPYGLYAHVGALAGKQYGQENAGNIPALSLINDFDWLFEQFQSSSFLS